MVAHRLRRLRAAGQDSPRVVSAYRRYLKERRFFTAIPRADLLRPGRLILLVRARNKSMLGYGRLSTLHDLAKRIDDEGVVGSIVECGSCNGGSAAVLAKSAPSRRVFLFDSWEGLPEPTEGDVSVFGKQGHEGMDYADESSVRRYLFGRVGLSQERVEMVRGWFQDTLPPAVERISPIALAHLDGDWYESIKFCLDTLYDAVAPGGYIAIDDYAYWQGCRRAVDDFIAERGLEVELNEVEVAVWFRKPTD